MSATRCKTFDAAALADVDAIRVAAATSESAQTLEGAALDGAIGSSRLVIPQRITVTSSAAAGAYVAGSAIVITGDRADGGHRTTERIELTAANGGETVATSGFFMKVDKIEIEAQETTTGTLAFGVRDAAAPHAAELRAGSAGNIALEFAGGATDTLPAAAGERFSFEGVRVLATGTTALPLTILV